MRAHMRATPGDAAAAVGREEHLRFLLQLVDAALVPEPLPADQDR